MRVSPPGPTTTTTSWSRGSRKHVARRLWRVLYSAVLGIRGILIYIYLHTSYTHVHAYGIMLYILLLLLYLCDYVVLSDRAAFLLCSLTTPAPHHNLGRWRGRVQRKQQLYGTPTPPPNVYNNNNTRHITRRRRSEESARAFLGHDIINWLLEVFSVRRIKTLPLCSVCVCCVRRAVETIALYYVWVRGSYTYYLYYTEKYYIIIPKTQCDPNRARGEVRCQNI